MAKRKLKQTSDPWLAEMQGKYSIRVLHGTRLLAQAEKCPGMGDYAERVRMLLTEDENFLTVIEGLIAGLPLRREQKGAST